ncbi:MAG: haloacid dehalogenase type II [Candidatus Rokuibacteriota bacterium]|nr:MAG: haloacid dehalogenase type II [Candidatus Rokubacteria bacterium]
MTALMTPPVALLFDTYGTLVDWRSSVLDDLARFGDATGRQQDWARFLADWKACYRGGMDAVNRGERPWTTVDALYRERLVELLAAIGLGNMRRGDVDHLTRAWWRLRPWPDVVAGLGRLRRRYLISPLSNASFAGMVHLAKFAGLPWDCVLTAENARCYKPRPEVYRTALALLGLPADEVMMVAAHNYDLAAAQALGLRTAFIPRPLEHGPGQTTDLAPEGKWDVIVNDVQELAAALGC